MRLIAFLAAIAATLALATPARADGTSVFRTSDALQFVTDNWLLSESSSVDTGTTCDRNATSNATLATQWAAATGGQTICLASGSYGTVTGIAKSIPGVTIKPASGATPTMEVDFRDGTPAAWTTLNGVTIVGGTLCNPTHDVTFLNTVITKEFDILTGPGVTCGSGGQMSGNHVVFDGAAFTQSADPTGASLFWEGRLSFGGGSSGAMAVQIKNSSFDGSAGPCADGIQMTNAANSLLQPVEVGPHDTFTGLLQGSCAAHVDSIQWVDGGGGINIHDNLFVNDSDGLVNFDASPAGVIAKNNVFKSIAQDPIHICATTNALIEHNTVVSSGNGEGITNCDNHAAVMGTNTTARNNIIPGPVANTCFTGGCSPAGSFTQNDYNLCTGGTCVGAHSVNGTPTWVGGLTPTTFAGFALTTGSLGHAVASDSTDIGVNP